MASVEQDLLNHLRFAGLDKDNLAALVKVVAGFSDKGVLKNFKVFPIGVPPVYEASRNSARSCRPCILTRRWAQSVCFPTVCPRSSLPRLRQ